MDEKLKDLNDRLERLLGLHKCLLEAVKTENLALSGADAKAIHQIAADKEALIYSIQEQEKARQAACTVLYAIFNLPIERRTLSELVKSIQVAHPERSRSYQSLLTAMRTLIERIDEQNSINRDLVQNALRHIEQMKANSIRSQMSNPGTYGSSGKTNAPRTAPRSQLIERQV